MLDSLTATLPAWAGRLDQVAATLAASVNAVHASGFDLSGTPGASFFTGTTASTIAVALTDPHQVAASAVPGGNLDNGTADAMAQLATSPTGPDAVYQQMVVDLGVQTQAATSRSTMQDTVAQQADSARQGQAGVSTDEEMVHLISYQHAYEAAARLMTTIDSTLDTLINHTGLIGG
jgi:flagellar hook-associated protein 1 FlgK